MPSMVTGLITMATDKLKRAELVLCGGAYWSVIEWSNRRGSKFGRLMQQNFRDRP